VVDDTTAPASVSLFAGNCDREDETSLSAECGGLDAPTARAAAHVVGAGCEIQRGTPLENVRAIVDFARATSGS
jgi:uroporphyrinogen-III decarboxylase